MRRPFVGACRLLALGLVALPAGLATAEDAKPPKKFDYAGTVRTMDPAMIEGPDDERLVLASYEGLTAVDPSTGGIRLAGAEKMETSADGKTWTFTLRAAKWQSKTNTGFEAKGDVKASDVVFGWRRLLDSELKSPNRHLLDQIVGVAALSTDKPRAEALDRIVGDLTSEIGPGKKSLTAEQVQTFLDDLDRGARHWLGELAALPEVKEILGWPSSNAAYQGLKATKLMAVLSKERDRSLAVANEADAHVGTDRGFFAKDDRTLVVQTIGPSPWLPSLLARGPLVAVSQRCCERKHDQAFNRRGNFVCNGAYVPDSDIKGKNDTSDGGDKTPYKVVLLKNPAYWDAANVPSDVVTCLVNDTPENLVRLYGNKELQWILAGALPLEVARGIRGAKAPAWKPDPKFLGSAGWPAMTGDAYATTGGQVFVVRFRCAPPFDKADTRRALASLIRREALASKAPTAVPPTPVTRFVIYPQTTGSLPSVRVPSFDASKALALYGPQKYKDGSSWITVLSPSADDQVADGLCKAWKAGKIPDDSSTTVQEADDYRKAIDAGRWDVAIGAWTPAFDDPLAYLSAFTTGNAAGATRWSSPVYDALIAGAIDVAAFAANPAPSVKDLPAVKAALGSSKDPKGLETLRRTLLAEAESLLLDEAVVVPLWQVVQAGFVQPQVRGVTVGGRVQKNLLDVQPLVGVAFDG